MRPVSRKGICFSAGKIQRYLYQNRDFSEIHVTRHVTKFIASFVFENGTNVHKTQNKQLDLVNPEIVH